ncbi:MAG TPA: SGNH/GDSL hydrolase family protein [Telluria sp.]
MRKTSYALALLTAAVLAACGGNGPRSGDQTTVAVKFTQQVSFGDSLSDVGTYAVGEVAALGGGKYTINGDNTSISPVLTGKNWTEVVAAQLGLPAPCAAQTGLQGSASLGFSVPIAFYASCYNYAQGGSRVSDPVGPGNAATGSPLGQTTVPVSTQIANHLAKVGGKFSGTEVVTVMAGGNDLLIQLAQLQAAATAAGTAAGNTAFATSLTTQLAAGATNPATAAQAIGLAIQTAAASGASSTDLVTAAVTAAVQAGNTAAASPTVYGPMVAQAQAAATTAGTTAGNNYASANGPAIVTAMGAAGTALAQLVETQIVAKGANYVVLNNLPDVASTPDGTSQTPATQQLIAAAVNAFNAQLKAGVASDAKVLYVDLFSISHDQVNNPAPYGLTNTSTPACDLSAAKNPLGSSLICTKNNLISGDVSHYMFADQIHPTPFEYSLVARYVLEQMTVKGWL